MSKIKPIKITFKQFALGTLLWTLWSVLFSGILVYTYDAPFIGVLFSSLISYYMLGLLSLLILLLCNNYPYGYHPPFVFVLIHFLTAALISAIWQVSDYGIHYLLWGDAVFEYKPLKAVAPFSFMQGMMIYAILAGIFYSSNYQKEIRQKELKTSQLESLSRQAELKALKSQVNPHFLFNTLNTIFALVDRDSKKAKRTITQLSDLLRYSMSGFYHEFVSLRQEIETIHTYLEIEKARFGAKLSVEEQIDDSVLDCQVPPMILQPLIENAVKHGISKIKEGGTIFIEIRKEDQLFILVKDTGKGVPVEDMETNNNGIGLTNLEKRLSHIYEDFSLVTRSIEPHGFEVEIIVPI